MAITRRDFSAGTRSGSAADDVIWNDFWTLTVKAGDLIVVGITNYNASGSGQILADVVTDDSPSGSNTYSRASSGGGDEFHGQELWWAIAREDGELTIEAQFPEATRFRDFQVASYSSDNGWPSNPLGPTSSFLLSDLANGYQSDDLAGVTPNSGAEALLVGWYVLWAGSSPVVFDDTADSELVISSISAAIMERIVSSAGTYTVSATAEDDETVFGVLGAAFYEAASAGATSVEPTGIASAEAFGSPSIVPGAVTIAPTGIASAEAFGSATLTAAYTITATGIASAEAFGTAALQFDQTLSPTSIASTEAFGAPSLEHEIVITGIQSLEAFGVPAIEPGEVIIAPSGIGSAEAFGTPIFATLVAPSGILSAEAFGSPTITTGAVEIAPTGIASAEAFGSPSIGEIAVVSPTGIASAEAFGSPSIAVGAVSIAPSGIPSAEAFGSPVLLGAGQLLTVGIPSAEAFGAPSIIQQYHSGYYIDGENEIEIDEVYGKLTTYSDGNGGFYSI